MFDVIAITETSQKTSNNGFLSNVEIDGFISHSIASNSNKGGSLLYINNKHKIKERTDLNIQNDVLEAVWIEIINTGSRNTICCSLYRHPNDNLSKYESFLDYIDDCLGQISSENKDIFICGDFNSDWLKIDTNSSYNKFYAIMHSYGLLPQILQPTRVTGNSATTIDNIFTNIHHNPVFSGNILTDFSDHFSQFISVPNKKADYKKVNYYKRDYSKFCEKSFRDDVSIQAFDNSLTDVNDQFKDFYLRLEGCVDRHAPLKKLSNKEIKLEQKPWISPNLRKMIRIRNKLFYRKKRQKNNFNVNRLYNLFRNRVVRECKKAKKTYFTNYFQENSKNIKKQWDGIRSIINMNKNKLTTINELKIENHSINNPKLIAEELNKFFTNIGPNTEKDLPKIPIIQPEKYLSERIQFDFLVAHVSNEEILGIIKDLDNSATGPISIPINLLKLIPDLILIPLCRIINNSFQSGIFPDPLKISKVIPIHKEGPTDDLNNYRPISLLSIFDKIIEKAMHKRLYSFLEQHNILYKNQFGFRKNNSTTYALIDLTEQIKESIDSKKHCCGVFIDIRKAFDTVNHNILLNKLEHYGVRGTELNWFSSYLSNRFQFVELNGMSSSLRKLTCGIPQGSCLGPLLFLIYINDLPNTSKLLNFHLFADDTHIYHESSTLKSLELVMNKELKKISTWLIVNRLSLNVKKTNFVLFHPFNKPLKQNITLKINNKAIKEVKYIRYLGVLLDSTLTWKHHILKVTKTLSKFCGLFYKIRPYVTIKILKMLYNSLIYSQLTYGAEVWTLAANSLLNSIFIIQKRLVRIMTFNDRRGENFQYPHSDPLFKRLDILKIYDIHKLGLCKFIYKYFHMIIPSNFHNWFTLVSQVHNYNTRMNYNSETSNNTNTLYVPFRRTTYYGLKQFKVQASKLWNDLPQLIKQKSTLLQFSNELKSFLINIY